MLKSGEKPRSLISYSQINIDIEATTEVRITPALLKGDRPCATLFSSVLVVLLGLEVEFEPPDQRMSK